MIFWWLLRFFITKVVDFATLPFCRSSQPFKDLFCLLSGFEIEMKVININIKRSWFTRNWKETFDSEAQSCVHKIIFRISDTCTKSCSLCVISLNLFIVFCSFTASALILLLRAILYFNSWSYITSAHNKVYIQLSSAGWSVWQKKVKIFTRASDIIYILCNSGRFSSCVNFRCWHREFIQI